MELCRLIRRQKVVFVGVVLRVKLCKCLCLIMRFFSLNICRVISTKPVNAINADGFGIAKKQFNIFDSFL